MSTLQFAVQDTNIFHGQSGDASLTWGICKIDLDGEIDGSIGLGTAFKLSAGLEYRLLAGLEARLSLGKAAADIDYTIDVDERSNAP